jgi:hypothetical protein
LDIRPVRSDQHTSGMSTCNVSTSSVSSCSTFRRSAHAHAVEVSLVVLHQPPDT